MSVLACWNHFPIISLLEIFRRLKALNSEGSGPIWTKFKLVRDFMPLLITLSLMKIQSKLKTLMWRQRFPHYKSMGAFCCHGKHSFDGIFKKISDKFEFRPDWIRHFRVTCPWAQKKNSLYTTLSDMNISKASPGQILFVASVGWGKGCIRFWGRLDQNCCCHGNQKLPLTYNGENGVSTFSQSFWIGSSPNLQVSRTGIKSQMSSNSSRIGSFTKVLRALEHWEKLLIDYNGIMMSPR